MQMRSSHVAAEEIRQESEVVDLRPAVSNMLATNHMKLFKFQLIKIKLN